jgi:hypothetical protein
LYFLIRRRLYYQSHLSSNLPNCLSQDLLEKESLPQVKNLLEIRFTVASFEDREEGGERIEANDGGTESGGAGDGAPVPASEQEEEGQDSG